MGVLAVWVGALLVVAVSRAEISPDNSILLTKVVPPVPTLVQQAPQLHQENHPILKQSGQSVVLPPGLYPYNPFFNHSGHVQPAVPPQQPSNQQGYYPQPSNPIPVVPPQQPPNQQGYYPQPSNPIPVIPPQQPPTQQGYYPPPAPQPSNPIPPINPQNPFFNQQIPYVPQPVKPVTSSPPSQPAGPVVPGINPQNPFLQQQIPYPPPPQPVKPVTSVPPYIPLINPSQPLAATPPPVPSYQPQTGNQLRQRCLTARGQFPSAKCNKFVNCWDDHAAEQYCPPGLAFNPAGFCDFIPNVDCQGKPFEEIPTVVSTPDIIAPPDRDPLPPIVPAPLTDLRLYKKCLAPRGLFPSDYCHKYVNCWEGNAIEQDCPPGLFFSEKGYCDYPFNVECKTRVLIALPSPPTNNDSIIKPPGLQAFDAKLRKKCLGYYGLYPSDYCNRYVNCWDQFAIEQDCPPGLLFSTLGYCDYPYNVNCYNRTILPTPIPPAADIKPEPPIKDVVSPPPFEPSVDSFQTLRPPSDPPVTIAPSGILSKYCLRLRGQFPSNYCNRYINCWDGAAIEQECPPGLLFSEKGYCDYPYNVNCGTRVIIHTLPINASDSLKPRPPSEVLAVLPQPPPIYRPPPPSTDSFQTLPPRPSDPQVSVPFWPPTCKPVTSKPPIYTLPPLPDSFQTLAPRPVTPIPLTPPIPPNDSFPTQRPLEQQPAAPISPDKFGPKCLRKRGQFPSDVCNRYVNCWDGIAIEQECPPGLLFSEKGYCDFAYNVRCNNRVIVPPTAAPPPTYKPPVDSFLTLPPRPADQPQPGYPTYRPPTDYITFRPPVDSFQTLLPRPDQSITPSPVSPDKFGPKCLRARGQFPSDFCNRYVNCWDGVAVEQDCPPGLLFSDKGYCDFGFNVNCGTRAIAQIPLQAPIEPGVPQQPQQPPAIPVIPEKRCLGLRGQFPTDFCHKYLDCWDSNGLEQECPAGLLFSEKGYCDHAHNVKCGSRTLIKSTVNVQCPIPNGTFRDRSNCSRYFTCINNAVVSNYECPSGLNYNDAIGVCDYSYRVDCSREPFIYHPLKKANFVQKLPADDSLECRVGRVYRLNPECTSAVLCRKSTTEVIHCPAGLAYDGPSDKCLPPQLAKCNDI